MDLRHRPPTLAVEGMPEACIEPLGSLRPAQPAAPPCAGSSRAGVVRDTYPTSAAVSWTAIAIFLSSLGQVKRLAASGNFETWDEHLLGRREAVLAFYPSDEPPELRAGLVRALNLTSCGAALHDGCERWSTPRGHHALTCAVAIDAPQLYGGSLQGARRTHLSSFCGKQVTGEYVVATKWFTLPMLSQPVLRRFDFWSKIDVDVCFRKPVRLTHELVTTRSWFMHTRLMPDPPVCQHTLGDFVEHYTTEHQCTATDATREWRPAGTAGAEQYPYVAYSNFIAGWTGFWLSERVLHFAAAWHAWEGGWRNRWTDQQFWMPALRVANVSEERITSLTHLRYNTFDHTKAANFCSQPRPLRNASLGKTLDVATGKWVASQARA